MNWVYLHLLTNHIPIILTGLGVLALFVAFASRKRIVWIYALTTLTLAGLSVYPVFFAGTQAEDVVEDRERTARERIHEHEEAAEWALWMILATGAASAYGLYRLRKDAVGLPPVWLRALVIVAGLFAISSVTKTALEGGTIRHEEWERSMNTSPETPPAPSDQR